jgi:hypothetical protein
LKNDEITEFNNEIEIEEFENLLVSENIFVGLIQFINYKFLNCTKNCVICDSLLGFSGMKLTVCDKELCIHSLDQYGLGLDLISEIKNHPEVVDLLITLTYSASELQLQTNGVREITPFPENISGFKKDNIKKLMDSLRYMSSLKKLGQCEDMDELVNVLNKKSSLVFPLFKWILTYFIILIKIKDQIGHIWNIYLIQNTKYHNLIKIFINSC